MKGKFVILGSSSNGNSAFLDTGATKILIDAGFSGKQINERLHKIGESIESLDAVFLTHEHNDHSVGIRGISSRSSLPIYVNRDTADAISTRINKPINWKFFQTGTDFKFKDLTIRSYSLPHDAYDPVGFSFYWGNPEDLFSKPGSLAWVTDLGYIPEHVKEQIQKVHTLVIESNFEPTLLDQDRKRPWSVKQRIKGRHGHLSNEATYSFLDSILGQSSIKTVYLAHLSKDCNCVKLVSKNSELLKKNHSGLEIVVVDPHQEFVLTT